MRFRLTKKRLHVDILDQYLIILIENDSSLTDNNKYILKYQRKTLLLKTLVNLFQNDTYMKAKCEYMLDY